LALLIKKTLSDESLQTQMSEAGKKVALQFDWHVFASGVLEQTLKVCRQKK
jgi:hypothetical protein